MLGTEGTNLWRLISNLAWTFRPVFIWTFLLVVGVLNESPYPVFHATTLQHNRTNHPWNKSFQRQKNHRQKVKLPVWGKGPEYSQDLEGSEDGQRLRGDAAQTVAVQTQAAQHGNVPETTLSELPDFVLSQMPNPTTSVLQIRRRRDT